MIPGDQASRDRIVESLHETCFVQAGAGTGKTRSLVDRVFALILSGTPVERIAAITFTEKAAGELKDRIRTRLEASIRDESKDCQTRAVCRIALAGLDAASIETLHAFARRILSMYPLEAGMPPGFQLLDEIQARIAFEDWWRETLDAMLSDEALAQSWRLGLDGRLKTSQLRCVAGKFHDNWDRLQDTVIPEPVDPEPAWVEFVGVCEALIGDMAQCNYTGDFLYQSLVVLRQGMDAMQNAETIREKCRAVRAITLPARNRGNKKYWDYGLEEIKNRVRLAYEYREEFLKAAHSQALHPLIIAIRNRVLDYARCRRIQGTLEFSDLLVLARNLLLENEQVRQEVSSRFDALLIDEYQDTDPLQVEIATLIALRRRPSGDFRWWEMSAEIPPGRLLFVGDPKQSIYRFRRADVQLFQKTRETIGGQVLELNTNFRSSSSVLNWVNEKFGSLMKQGFTGSVAYSNLYSGLEHPPLPQSGVYLFGDELQAKVGVIRQLEADAVAAVALGALADRLQIPAARGDASAGTRDIRLSDIAILMPRRAALPALEDSLRKLGIPYRVESQSLLFATEEARVARNLLKAVDDPTDQVAIVAALKGPGFSCTDQELYDYHLRGGRWDYRTVEVGAENPCPVESAMAHLLRFHQIRLQTPPALLLELILERLRVMESAACLDRSRDRWRRFRFIVEQARQFTASTRGTLRQFLNWLDIQESENARVAETVVPEPDDDAVRILTIHAAKGLEFPMVILMGLDSGQSGDKGPRVVWDCNGRIAIRCGAENEPNRYETPGADVLLGLDRLQEREEDLRLLYVAATRAQYYLFVSLFRKLLQKNKKAENQDPPSLVDRLAENCLSISDNWIFPLNWELSPLVSPLDVYPPDTQAQYEDWLQARTFDLHLHAHLPALAGTAIAKGISGLDAPEPGLEKDSREEDDFVPSQRGRAGTRIGRAVHATLQSVDLLTGAGLEQIASAQAAAEGLGEDEAGIVADLAFRALQTPELKSLLSGCSGFWREVFVCAQVDEVLVEGFIDLLVQRTDGSYVILDYKTDSSADPDRLETLMDRYKYQGAAYALALQAALGVEVQDIWFLFCASEPAVIHKVPGFHETCARVRDYLKSAGST